MSIYRLIDDRDYGEISVPEASTGLRLGYFLRLEKYFLIVADQVGVVFDNKVSDDLNQFYGAAFGFESKIKVDRFDSVSSRIETWLGTLPKHELGKEYQDFPVGKSEFFSILAEIQSGQMPPPLPPSRPDLATVGSPPTIGSLPPFETHTRHDAVFYRFEPWPTSKRINQANFSIAPQTYAAPSSELAFAPTGFAAVARYALPLYFPAVFRWELQPQTSTPIRCGAVVPRFNQSGGGVEVYFAKQVTNRGPIANPVVLQPL